MEKKKSNDRNASPLVPETHASEINVLLPRLSILHAQVVQLNCLQCEWRW